MRVLYKLAQSLGHSGNRNRGVRGRANIRDEDGQGEQRAGWHRGSPLELHRTTTEVISMSNHSDSNPNGSRPLQEAGSTALQLIRAELVRLASREDRLAAEEAVRAAYWEATPPSVISRRLAATILREAAEQLSTAPSPSLARPLTTGWSR
ncbi:hypothetical protein GCM10022237_25520 [Nocardioides ginsengisoli]